VATIVRMLGMSEKMTVGRGVCGGRGRVQRGASPQSASTEVTTCDRLRMVGGGAMMSVSILLAFL